MAKGYWNLSGAITNPEGMGPYLQAVEPYLAKFNARFLCRDLNTDVREGDAGHLTVIIEFESLAAAKAAYGVVLPSSKPGPHEGRGSLGLARQNRMA